MFKKTFRASKDKVTKRTKIGKSSFTDENKSRLKQSFSQAPPAASPSTVEGTPTPSSPIIEVAIGNGQRRFGAHEHALNKSPWLKEACRNAFFSPLGQKQISIPDVEPETFSAVLEFLYKGDYDPHLVHNTRRNTWSLEGIPVGADMTPRSFSTTEKTFAGLYESPTVYSQSVDGAILLDTAVYCLAQALGLPELQRVALRKQGLRSGIEVATILRSARYAYAYTPGNDSRLRAHYLALIVRSRKVFKRSTTMQREMMKGGTDLFFDLFTAMCNHMDDMTEAGSSRTPRSVK